MGIENKKSSIHDKRYRALIKQVVGLRKDARILQHDLATKLGVSQSYISKIERCERRLDIIELVDYIVVVNPQNSNEVLFSILKDILSNGR